MKMGGAFYTYLAWWNDTPHKVKKWFMMVELRRFNHVITYHKFKINITENKVPYLAWWLDAPHETQKHNKPGEGEHQEQLPADASDIFNASWTL